MKLLDFDFKIIYKKRKQNKLADALFKNSINNINNLSDLTNINENYADQFINTYDNKQKQENDIFCSDIRKALNNINYRICFNKISI